MPDADTETLRETVLHDWHAEAGAKISDEAFYEMVRWTSGEFVIEHGVKSKESSISQDSMFLLMEGLRLMDEDGDPEAVAAS